MASNEAIGAAVGGGEGNRIVGKVIDDAARAEGRADGAACDHVLKCVSDAVGIVDLAVLIDVDGAAVGIAFGVVGNKLGDVIGVLRGDNATEIVVSVDLETNFAGTVLESGFESGGGFFSVKMLE